jgi:hypothetical protein
MVLNRRRAVLLAVAVVVVLAVTRLGTGSSGVRDPSPPPPTFVTVQAAAAGRHVPFGFLGLSTEYQAVEAYAGSDPASLDPVFEQLVRNLAPSQAPVLRIGGDSADRTWRPTSAVSQPPGVRFAITDRWLAVTRALADDLRARLIVDLNLEAGSPRLAAAEAGALIDGVGHGAIRALELGNEPDLYPTFPWYRTADGRHVTGRPPNYDMSGLIGDFTSFASALPRLALAGPSLGAPGWTRQLGRFLADEPRVRLVTLHRYPLQLCYTPRSSARYPTLQRLLMPTSSIGLADSFARYVGIARARHLSLRIDELNTVSCGAVPAVSQSFASALWALNTLFEMVRVGIHGVNVHTFPGAGYELFRMSRPDGAWSASVAPEYYGLLMFAAAAPAGSRLLAVSNGSGGTLRTWATRSSAGTIRVLAVNTGSQARLVRVGVAGPPPGEGQLQLLTAPSVRSRTGVTLAGQTFGASTRTGLLAGGPRTLSLSPVGGRYEVWLPAGSAGLLVLSPPASAVP